MSTTASGTYQDLQRVSDHYSVLHDKFAKFFADIEKRVDDIADIEPKLEDHCSEGYFRAHFCERSFEFRFSAHLSQNGDPIAIVAIYSKPHPLLVLSPPVTTFTYDRQGLIIDVAQPDDHHNVLRIDNPNSAVFLFARCLHIALSVRPEAQIVSSHQ